METTIRPLENGDCILIPKKLLKEACLSRGDTIEIKCDSEKHIIISKANKRLTLSEIIGDWEAPEDYELYDFGNPAGSEVW